tara:strand:- start:5972 stop:6130 length:159 start_codon:yes stop_codon:yes gene_type:complete
MISTAYVKSLNNGMFIYTVIDASGKVTFMNLGNKQEVDKLSMNHKVVLMLNK